MRLWRRVRGLSPRRSRLYSHGPCPSTMSGSVGRSRRCIHTRKVLPPHLLHKSTLTKIAIAQCARRIGAYSLQSPLQWRVAHAGAFNLNLPESPSSSSSAASTLLPSRAHTTHQTPPDRPPRSPTRPPPWPPQTTASSSRPNSPPSSRPRNPSPSPLPAATSQTPTQRPPQTAPQNTRPTSRLRTRQTLAPSSCASPTGVASSKWYVFTPTSLRSGSTSLLPSCPTLLLRTNSAAYSSLPSPRQRLSTTSPSPSATATRHGNPRTLTPGVPSTKSRTCLAK